MYYVIGASVPSLHRESTDSLIIYYYCHVLCNNQSYVTVMCACCIILGILRSSYSSAAVQHAVRSQDSVYHTLYIHIIVINSLAVPPAADVIVP